MMFSHLYLFCLNPNLQELVFSAFMKNILPVENQFNTYNEHNNIEDFI